MTTSRKLDMRELMTKTIDKLVLENERLEAVIVERDSIIARLEAGQSATASLERWRDEQD